MKNTSCFQLAYERLDAAFHLHSIDVVRDPKKRNIHRLRVTMKKQKSFIRMMKKLDSRFPVKFCKESVDLFFDPLGRARSIQVHRAVMKQKKVKDRLPPSYLFDLKVEATNAMNDFLTFEKEHSLMPIREIFSIVESHLQNIPPELFNSRLAAYFSELFGKTRQKVSELKTEKDPEKLHKLRRHLKDLHFNLQVLDDCSPGYKMNEGIWERIEQWEGLFGDWHDLYQSLLRLKKDGDVYSSMEAVSEKVRKLENSSFERIQTDLPRLDVLINMVEMETKLALGAELPANPPPRP